MLTVLPVTLQELPVVVFLCRMWSNGMQQLNNTQLAVAICPQPRQMQQGIEFLKGSRPALV
jgi:predicted TIM-barrel fold metal-dependent hydrolase